MRGAVAASRAFTVKIKVRANPIALTRRFGHVVWCRRTRHRRRRVTIGDLNYRRGFDSWLSLNHRLRYWRWRGNDRRFFNNLWRFFGCSRFGYNGFRHRGRCFRLDGVFRLNFDGFCDNVFDYGFIGFCNQLRLFINRGGDSFRMGSFNDRDFRFVNHRHRFGDGCAIFGCCWRNDFRNNRLGGSRWRNDRLSRSDG